MPPGRNPSITVYCIWHTQQATIFPLNLPRSIAKMPIQSDLTLNISKFQPSSVSEDTKKLNTLLEDITAKTPRWYKVGVAKYREMRENGETPLGLPTYLPAARDATVPSREAGREIPVRVYEPENGQPSKGIFLHFHGGGFVMASHKQ